MILNILLVLFFFFRDIYKKFLMNLLLNLQLIVYVSYFTSYNKYIICVWIFNMLYFFCIVSYIFIYNFYLFKITNKLQKW